VGETSKAQRSRKMTEDVEEGGFNFSSCKEGGGGGGTLKSWGGHM